MHIAPKMPNFIPHSILCVALFLTTYTHAFFDFFEKSNLIFFPFTNPFDVFKPQTHTSQTTPPIHIGNYDYIIVGAGAAGCPLAYTLSEAGYSTLLIERGMKRQDIEAKDTLYINGLSNPINSPLLSQLVVTPQGIRTHIAHVMGGGTSLNLGIYTEEDEDYYTYLETFPDVHFDRKLLNESTEWVYKRTASPMPFNDTFGTAWRETMENLGYEPHQNVCNNTGASNEQIDEYHCEDGSLHTHSRRILFDKYWGGMSLFNSENYYFRAASDVLLYHQNGTIPSNLHILTEHNVERVLFDTSGPTPRAQCVEFRNTPKNEPIESINPFKKWSFNISWEDLFSLLSNPILAVKNLFKTNTQTPLQKVCLKNEDGEIILSSGAIMSSVILFKSGVGPSDVIEKLNIPKVKEISNLGKNFSDRVFIPVGFFFDRDLPPSGHFDGRVCRGIGLHKTGNNCTEFKIGEENMQCSLVPIEEFSGAAISENIFYASRYAFPPEWRDHPILDITFEFFEKCSADYTPFGSIVLKPFCKLIKPILSCLRKSGSNFYFTSEPKSKGEVRLEPDGTIIANPNYLSHDQDLMDAIRGVAELTKQINMNEFKPLLEKYNKKDSCPSKIYNGILELITNLASTLATHELDIHKVLPLRSLLEKVKSEGKSTQVKNNILERRLESLNITENNSTTPKTEFNDEFSKEIDKLLREIEQHLKATISLDENGELYELDKRGLSKRLNSIKQINTQWAATFPPTLPDITNPVELAKYAMNYMSSVWHHSGSASLGTVVDNNFNVKGVENLSIVDASNLNQISRLNPSATIMMLGRYAGKKKVQNRAPPYQAL